MNYLLVLIILVVPSIAYSAPSISSVSGTVSHGQSITISSSNTSFTSKSTAAPLIWDDCSGTNISTKWSGGWPSGGDSSRVIKYQTPIRGVSLPHSHVTKYMTGGFSQTDTATGYNVGPWKTLSGMSFPTTMYFSAYRQVDPNWDIATDGSDNNFKIFDTSNGSSPYTMNGSNDGNWYLDYAQTSSGADSGQTRIPWEGPWWEMNDDGWGALPNPPGEVWFDGGPSPIGNWVKTEIEIKYATDSTGYVKVWENGAVIADHSGKTMGWSGTTKTFGFVSYSRQKSSNSWLYFSDLYFDTTPQRVVICAGSTWASRGVCEVQIPTTWSTSSITATVNQATFADASTKYLYVVDSAGANSTGYSVTFGAGEADTTAPTVTSAAVNGSTVTVNFDETVVTTGYDAADFNLDCTTAGQNISLTSPSGSGASRTFTAATPVGYGDTCNLDYVGSTDDIEDAAGNDLATFSNLSVTVNTPDTTAPTTTISTSSPQAISADSLTVTGTASDNAGVSGVKYRIGSAPDATHGTACTGTTSWSCSTSGYASGANTLYVSAYDAAGNYTSSIPSITVNYTPVSTGAVVSGGVCKGCTVRQ